MRLLPGRGAVRGRTGVLLLLGRSDERRAVGAGVVARAALDLLLRLLLVSLRWLLLGRAELRGHVVRDDAAAGVELDADAGARRALLVCGLLGD